MKLKHIALIGSLFPILFSVVLFFGVLISADSDDENSNFSSGITGMNLSAEVLKLSLIHIWAKTTPIWDFHPAFLSLMNMWHFLKCWGRKKGDACGILASFSGRNASW